MHLMNIRPAITASILLSTLMLCLSVPVCHASDVIIIGDTRLKPVVEIISGIRKTLRASTKTYAPPEVKDTLRSVVEKEEAKVVVALGREALVEALQLPSSITVIYDLVVIPPKTTRPNTTGFYMAIPAKDYLDLISSHLNSIKHIAVVGNRDQLSFLAGDTNQHLTAYSVKNAYEFVNTLRQVNSADAILLMPDASLLTETAMEEAYLLSFRRGIPLIGISERQVKEGALLALVVDTVNVGRLIGEYATKAIKGINVGLLPPSPPKRFELYLNTDTARKMGIHIPDEMVRMAKKAYP